MTIQTRFGLVLSLVLLLVLPLTPVNSSPRTRIFPDELTSQTMAVTRLEPRGRLARKQEWLSKALRVLIHDDLIAINRLRTLPFVTYDQLLAEHNLDKTRANRGENLGRISQATGAELLVVGAFRAKARRLSLRIGLWSARKTELISVASTTTDIPSVPSAVRELVVRLLRKRGAIIREEDLPDRSDSILNTFYRRYSNRPVQRLGDSLVPTTEDRSNTGVRDGRARDQGISDNPTSTSPQPRGSSFGTFSLGMTGGRLTYDVRGVRAYDLTNLNLRSVMSVLPYYSVEARLGRTTTTSEQILNGGLTLDVTLTRFIGLYNRVHFPLTNHVAVSGLLGWGQVTGEFCVDSCSTATVDSLSYGTELSYYLDQERSQSITVEWLRYYQNSATEISGINVGFLQSF